MGMQCICLCKYTILCTIIILSGVPGVEDFSFLGDAPTINFVHMLNI